MSEVPSTEHMAHNVALGILEGSHCADNRPDIAQMGRRGARMVEIQDGCRVNRRMKRFASASAWRPGLAP